MNVLKESRGMQYILNLNMDRFKLNTLIISFVFMVPSLLEPYHWEYLPNRLEDSNTEAFFFLS